MTVRTDTVKTGIIFIAVIIIVGMFAYIMFNRQGAGTLTIKTGDSELVMDFAENKLNFSELISMLLTDKKYRSNTLSILRDSYGLYEKHSDLLVDHIRKESGDSDFSEKFRELLIDLKGPFKREFHKHYDITNEQVVRAINELGYNHTVAVELRKLRDRAEGIFEQRGIDVDIAVSSAERILNGNAAVCVGSEYRGRDLLLLNQNNSNRTISVFARNSFPCIKPEDGGSDTRQLVQVNSNDATKLFGNIIFEKKEQAILYPAQTGYNINPRLVGVSN